MKKLLALFLALVMGILSFSGCGEGGSAGQSSEESSAYQGGEGGSVDTSEESKIADGTSKYPRDVLEDLPYTIVCKDKYTKEAVEYQFTDNGRLNDGIFRSEEELENETNAEARVDLEGTSTYNFEITFVSDGTYDGYRLIAHNCDFYFSFLKLEVGDDIDDMTELEFEDDHDITVNGHMDNYADFEVTTIKLVRITVTTGTSSHTSLDELSLLGFPKGEADKWMNESVAESSAPDTSGETDSLLVGVWGADDPEIVEKGGDDYKVVLTFVSDGTGTYMQAGLNMPFTWYTANGTLYMNVAIIGPLVKPYSFRNGVLFLPDEDGRTTQFVKL